MRKIYLAKVSHFGFPSPMLMIGATSWGFLGAHNESTSFDRITVICGTLIVQGLVQR